MYILFSMHRVLTKIICFALIVTIMLRLRFKISYLSTLTPHPHPPPRRPYPPSPQLPKVATESLTSPDSRTPLKTLTRCLMEPRAAWDAEHLIAERGRSGTQPPGGADSHGKASANSVVRAPLGASARTRTLSCDSDVRTSSSSSSTSSSCTGPRPRAVSSGSSVRTISIELVGKAPTTRGEEVGRLGDSYPSSSSPSSPTPSPSSSSSSSASKTAGRSVLPQGVPVPVAVPVAVADSNVLAGSSLRAPVTCVAVPYAKPQRLSPGSEQQQQQQQQQLGPRSELEPSGSWSEQLGSKSKQLSPRSEYVSSRSEQSSSRSEQLSSRSEQSSSRSEQLSSRSEQLGSRSGDSCRSSGQSGSRSGDSGRSEQQLGSSSERLGSGSSAMITGSSSSSSASCFSSSSSSLPRASADISCEGRSANPPGPLRLLTSSTPVLPSHSAQDGGAGGPTPEGGDWVVGGRDLFPPNARLSQQSREGAAVTARFPKGVAHQQQYHHQVSSSSGVQTSDTSAQGDVAGPPGPQGRRGVPQQQGCEQEQQAASMTTSGAASHFRYAPVPAARTVPVQVVGSVGSNLRVTVASSLARAPPAAPPPLHHHQPFGAPTQASATVAGGAGGVGGVGGGATSAADTQSQPVAAPRLQPSSPFSSSSSSSSQSLGATGRPQPLSLQPTSGSKPQPTTGPTFTPTLLRLSQPTLLVPARLRAQSVAAAPTTTTPASRQHHQGRPQQQQQQQQQLLSPRVFGNPGARPRFVAPLFRSKLSPILPRRAPLRIRLPVTHSSSAPSSSSSSSSSGPGPGPGPGRPIPVRHVDTCSACLKTGPGPDPVPTSSPAPVPATALAQQIAASGGVGPSVVGGKANGAFDARERLGMVTTTTATATTASATAGSGKAETSPEGGRAAVEDGVQAVGVGDGPMTASLSLPGGVLKLLEKSAEGEGEGGGGGGSEGEGRTIPILDLRTEVPWKERRSRIDSALSWLRTELVSTRITALSLCHV